MQIKENTNNFNQALWLGVGQLSNAVLGFLSAAILARYFNKYDYGTYKQVIYIYTTLSTLFIVGLPSAFGYFLPRMNPSEQKQLIKSINRLFVFSGLLFSVILFCCSDIIARLLNNPDLSLAIKIFSPFPLFTLPTLGVEGIYTALKRTKQIAYYTVASRIISLIFIISPVIFFNLGYIGAIIGWGIANFFIFIIAMYMKNRPYVGIKAELVPNMYKSIFSYCLPLVGAFVAGFFISSAGQFFISRYYGASAFADFSNGNFSIPFVAMITSSIKSVLTPVISKAHYENNFNLIKQTYTNACTQAIILVFPMIVFMMCFAESAMEFIYSEKYYTSAPYLRMYLLRDFCSALPYFAILMAFGLSKVYLNLHILGAVFVWMTDFVAVKLLYLQPSMVVFNDSFFHILTSVIVFYYLIKKYKLNLFSPALILTILKVLANTIIVGVGCIYIVNYLSQIYGPLSPLMQLLIGGCSYLIILIPSGKLFNIRYYQVLMRFKK